MRGTFSLQVVLKPEATSSWRMAIRLCTIPIWIAQLQQISRLHISSSGCPCGGMTSPQVAQPLRSCLLLDGSHFLVGDVHCPNWDHTGPVIFSGLTCPPLDGLVVVRPLHRLLHPRSCLLLDRSHFLVNDIQWMMALRPCTISIWILQCPAFLTVARFFRRIF